MAEERRPSPDLLLKNLAQEEDRKRKGRLKVFFGMAPGVGKTYAMLSEAQALKREGGDVVIGWVETHGRAETEALTEGLARIPPANLHHRGVTLKEFDLQAALALHPDLLIVDELAHTNAPGSRHVRRYQDVLELLDAGITIFTTLNVQHLESLNDIVAGITGVTVRERVPDSVFERADEVELVDLSPEELLKRLEEGKVYIPAVAVRAKERFFGKGNLTALRELALRRTAERVHSQSEQWREEQGIRRSWATSEKLMVALGPAPQSANLVRAAYRMASRLQAPWIAVNVENTATDASNAEDKGRIRAHLSLAEQLGAEILILRGENVSPEILAAARERGVTRLMVGKPAPLSLRDRLRGSPVDRLIRDSGGIDILVTTGQPGEEKRVSRKPPARKAPWTEYAWAVAAVLVTTGFCWLVRSNFTLGDHALVYILTILAVSMRLSRWPAMLTALLSVAAVDFFFVPPFFTFVVADLHAMVTFVVLLAVGLSVSSLTLRVRQQARSARDREKRTSSLYALSRQLTAERKLDAICGITAGHIKDVLKCGTVIRVPDEDGQLAVRGDTPDWAQDEKEFAVALWAFQRAQPAGHGTDTLPVAEAFYLPVGVADKTFGVLGIRGEGPDWLLTTSERQDLEVIVSLLAQAVERTRLAKEAHHNQVMAETERLRNDLLSTVSHDLRTPLASLAGAASLLTDPEARLSDAGKSEMLRTIQEETGRLDRLIGDVSELTRLESPAIKLKKEWCPFEDVLSSALTRLSATLAGRDLNILQPKEMALVPIDPVLIEQAMINLLENAAKYTPPGTPIDVLVELESSRLRVSVADRGPGVPSGEEARIFEKYHRVMGDRSAPGMGVGLALCKAIIVLHGGRIEAGNREGGGAVFRFTLPLGDNPPMLKDLGP